MIVWIINYIFNDGKEEFNAFFEGIWSTVLSLQKGLVELGILLYVIIFGTQFVVGVGVFGLAMSLLGAVFSVVAALFATGVATVIGTSVELASLSGQEYLD